MKTSKILLHSSAGINERSIIRTGAGKLLKPILLIFMLFWIMLLSSCMFPGPGRERHEGNERRGQNEGRSHNDRHDNGERHDNDDHRDRK